MRKARQKAHANDPPALVQCCVVAHCVRCCICWLAPGIGPNAFCSDEDTVDHSNEVQSRRGDDSRDVQFESMLRLTLRLRIG